MTTYNRVYKKNYKFLNWCEYWQSYGFSIRHTSWKPFYPSFNKIEKSSPELINQYSKPHLASDKDFMGIDTEGFKIFFNKDYFNKPGDWFAVNNSNVDDLFE